MRVLLLAALLSCTGTAPVDPAGSMPTASVPAAPAPATPDPAPVAPVPTDPAPAAPVPAATEPAPAAPSPPSVVPDPAPRTSVPVVTSPPPELYACETDADCVIECDLPGNCCGAPCGCRTAVNRHVLAELKTHPWGECTREDARRCPAVGCAYDPAFSSTCEAGRCRASDLIDGLRRE